MAEPREEQDIPHEMQSDKELRVLVIYYSFSGQTVSLLNRFSAGLGEQGVQVVTEKLRPKKHLRFPIGTVFSTIRMMLTTFVRQRVEIHELSEECRQDFDLIILGGPTWSYNPSGPVLSLIDRDGPSLFGNCRVIPLISCRGYWWLHWFGLRRMLARCGAETPNLIVFSHPHKEPWRTLGVFLKLAGKNPERLKIIGRYYKKFGHSRAQSDEAWRFGMQLGEALKRQRSLADLDFKTELSLP